MPTLKMLEANIIDFSNNMDRMNRQDFIRGILQIIENHLELREIPVMLNKHDYEYIRSRGVSFINELPLSPIWASSLSKAPVTQEEIRNLSVVFGTMSFLYSRNYLTKPIKINIENNK